jgi:hypothetical protein
MKHVDPSRTIVVLKVFEIIVPPAPSAAGTRTASAAISALAAAKN